MIIQSVIEMQFNIIILSALDRKWATTRLDIIKHKLKKVNKTVEIIVSDGRENINSRSGQLPGGIITIVLRRAAKMIIKSQ